jgi:hypothetical protein
MAGAETEGMAALLLLSPSWCPVIQSAPAGKPVWFLIHSFHPALPF